MSNIDKRALREAAERAGQNDWEYVYTSDLSAPGRGYITVGGAEAIYCLNKAAGGVKQSENVLRYIAAASPETMLALLDDLEAAEHTAAVDHEAACSLVEENEEVKRKLAASEKRIAELRDWNAGLAQESFTYQQRVAELDNSLCELLPGTQYMDPPDGGNVTPLEQVRRMIADYRHRIAELEARTVKFPQTIWYDCDGESQEIAVLEKRLVEKALCKAGVKFAAGIGKGE
ncbi:TPA: ead/Ea22-like family protein [Citrobacter farmeri]|nr:ead/Ea22-like family protein [Citrobacter farmeri]